MHTCAQLKTFGQRLQYLMDMKKVSHQDVADGIGKDRARISNWVNDKITVPRRATIRKIADYFGCSIGWLATGEGDVFEAETMKRDMVLIGNGSVMAGRHIKGNVTLGGQEQSALELSAEERELILLLREVGGKKVLKKFKDELERIKAFIEEQI